MNEVSHEEALEAIEKINTVITESVVKLVYLPTKNMIFAVRIS